MSRCRQLISALLMLTFILSGCAANNGQQRGTPTGAARGSALSDAPEQVRIGVVVFLSGGAAEPFGIPAKNGAEAIVASINSGGAPPPYDVPGIAGVPISIVFADENGGNERQIAEFHRLFDKEGVDLVIGYISSSDCLAVAPEAEVSRRLLVAFDCGASRLFEEREYQYVFRTNAHQAIDSIGGARYLLEMEPDLHAVAGINQNYAWGQDSWAHFRDTLKKLNPAVKIVSEQFPKVNAESYTAEISALQKANSQIIHSSFWGADLANLITQARQDDLFQSGKILLSVGESAMPELGERIPEGTIIGAHGPHGVMAPESELNEWLVSIYKHQYDRRPTYPVYHMAQALLGVKLAYERAILEHGRWPKIEEVIRAFTYLEFPSPSGLIQMAIGKGHQAVEPAVYGTAGKYDPQTGEVRIVDLRVYSAKCVNPPDGMTTEQWIKDGFPGSECP